MTKKRWQKPQRKWYHRRQSISVLFVPDRVKAIDRRAQQVSDEEGIKVNRSMILNDLVSRDPEMIEIEKQIKQEERDEKRRQRGRSTDRPAA